MGVNEAEARRKRSSKEAAEDGRCGRGKAPFGVGGSCEAKLGNLRFDAELGGADPVQDRQ